MIDAGVAQELAWAQEAGIPILELPSQILKRSLSVNETQELLGELGQR